MQCEYQALFSLIICDGSFSSFQWFIHIHASINKLLSSWVKPADLHSFLSVHISPFWYSFQLFLVTLVPLDSHLCLLNLERSLVFAWRSLFCTTTWKQSQIVSRVNHGFYLVSLPLSGIIILHWLMSSDLNPVVSYILSSLCGCFRQKYKSCPSCSTLARSGNVIISF